MPKKGIVVLPPENDKELTSVYGDVPDMKVLLSSNKGDDLGDVGVLYDFVSDPDKHIKDKINALLKLQMYYSKEILTKGELGFESVQVYRIRKEAVHDLKRMIELLNEYSSVDNFDVDHPLYNKSLTFIIEAILIAIKANTEVNQFDSIVREVAISLPTIESRVRNMVRDSSTEEILALRDNPIMDSLDTEKKIFQEYLNNYEDFLLYLKERNNAK